MRDDWTQDPQGLGQTPTLAVRDLTTRKKARIGPISADFKVGVTALSGPNGAGKTTLLKALAGQIPVYRGSSVTLKNLGPRSQAHSGTVALLPQHPTLPGRLSVAECLNYAAWLRRVEASRLESIADSLSLSDVLQHRIDTLSGGETQRVAIATALLSETPVLLLDEPTSGLDSAQRRALLGTINRLGRNRIVVMTTHIDSDLAIADQVLVMIKGIITSEDPSTASKRKARSQTTDTHT